MRRYGEDSSPASDLRAYWKHLRIPFQLSLAPLFLWGYCLGMPSHLPEVRAPALLRVTLAFVSFHLFLYSGITAFNTAYDRDEGPVGGMLQPPPPPRYLLQFSLLVQAAGAILAWWVDLSFVSIYLVIVVLGAAYSHPRTRWKASPIASTLTVMIGQGALGFLAGWVTVRNGWTGIEGERGVWGTWAAMLTTLGLYPLTQVYQIEEDRRRGDRTLAVVLGPVRALLFGFSCLMLAGCGMILLMARTSTGLDTILISAAYALILWQVARFAQQYRRRDHTVVSAFRTTMRLNFLASAGFLLFIALHLFRIL
jgi:4-hydroxybenzoate polyprenyltransferase